MNTKVLTLVVGALMLLPAGYAAGEAYKFDDNCPSGYDCEFAPDDGGPFPPRAVTGHTVYAAFVLNQEAAMTLGLPTDFAAIAGYFAINENKTLAKQRECVVWFNGYNLDQRPDPDNFGNDTNAFPSDEDQDPSPGGMPNHDDSYQDYDFDRDVADCVPFMDMENRTRYLNYAVAVEQGDCDPMDGFNHQFRAHLDFVDPNNIYHEVQEYSYECNASGPLGNWLVVNGDVKDLTGQSIGEHVEDFFPATGSDVHNNDGCQMYDNPTTTGQPLNGQLGYFDFGHKCNGSIRDLFTERMWMTEFHNVTFDPTIQAEYNFALQIDTCAGFNIYEGVPVPGLPFLTGPGKEAMEGENNTHPEPYMNPQGGFPPRPLSVYHTLAYDVWYSTGLGEDWPLYDVCTDGSSFSFDDTPRGRVVHEAPPVDGPGSTEIMRGNSYDYDSTSDTFGKHRTNCRKDFVGNKSIRMDWPYNTYPPYPEGGDETDCYPEDHKTASVDIYVYDQDPTGGLWLVNTNGLTGPNAFTGPGCSTDERGFADPGQAAACPEWTQRP